MTTQEKNLASIVSYFGFIGWIISYLFIYPKQKNELNRWHITQALWINIIWLVIFFLDLFLEERFDNSLIDLIVWISWIVIFMVLADGVILAMRRCYRPVIVFGKIISRFFNK